MTTLSALVVVLVLSTSCATAVVDATDSAEATAPPAVVTVDDAQTRLPVARQLPWLPAEEQVILTLTHTEEGVLRFAEPGCLTWQSNESGQTYAVLALPGTTYGDGLLYSPAGNATELGDALGHSDWWHRDELEASDLVDPATPLAEMCPQHELFIAFGWRTPPAVDNETTRFLEERHGAGVGDQ